MRVNGVEVLVRFSRMAASAEDLDAILELLASMGVERAGADASAVLRVARDGSVQVVAGVGLPPEVTGPLTIDTIGPELAAELLSRAGGRFVDAITMPLVADADLFGVLVLFFTVPGGADPRARLVAEGLCDLAAISLSKAERYADLARSHEELRASREVLARSEKLRALGQMAAGVSHDLKNLLNPLGLLLQLARRRIEKGGDVLAVIDQLEVALKTGVQTVERLRDFSRQEPERAIVPLDLDATVAHALEVAGPRVGQARGLVLERMLGSGVMVRVDSSSLVNAIVNLVLNATEAVPHGGTIAVSSGVDPEGAWVRVQDDGPGMPPEVEQRVFEPFFTTKDAGTGLGLANVYAWMQRSGGRVELTTAPGEGARFTLRFPLSDRVPRA